MTKPHLIPPCHDLLSVADFARAIGVGLRTGYDMVTDGRVAVVPVGNHRIAVPSSEVSRLKDAPWIRKPRASAPAKETSTTA
jgi:hypothetical protein